MAVAINGEAAMAMTAKDEPRVKEITVGDIWDSIADGMRDFQRAPQFGLFFGAVYMIGGWLLYGLLSYFELEFLVYPLATGFALIAPFVATGLYDVSRRIERGEPLSWSGVLGSIRGSSGREIVWMALVMAFALIIWLDMAALLVFGFLGLGISSMSFSDMLREVFTTPSGLLFLVLGNLVGAILAATVFSISVVSFPMLYDRNVDFVTAMVKSVRTVARNPFPMLLWALVIGALLLLCLASGLIALLVVLPLLGHTTWHVYRRVIDFAPATKPN